MENNKLIKVGFCVSYDWELLRKSVPRIYAQADLICLALDKDRKSWSRNTFEFDDHSFYKFVKELDVEKKIDIYEGCFSLPDLNARQNCNRHRMLIAERMGKGGWHLQIDSDEYFLDFAGFVDELRKINRNPTGSEKPVNVLACWVPLIKKIDGGYLYVNFKNQIPETAPFATSKPDYQRARHNGHFNILLPYYVIHETWARSEDDLWFKISNWGHSSEELDELEKRQSYFNLWKSLDSRNFQYVSNIHPTKGETWPALGYCSGDTIDSFITNFVMPNFPLRKWELRLANSRNIGRIKWNWNKIFTK